VRTKKMYVGMVENLPAFLPSALDMGWVVSVSQPSSFIPWATVGGTHRIRDWVFPSRSRRFLEHKSRTPAGNRTTIPRKSSPWRVH